MKIELTPEQIDKVVIKEIQNNLKYLLDPTQDVHETAGNKIDNVYSHLRVLKYFMAPSDFEKYKEKVL